MHKSGRKENLCQIKWDNTAFVSVTKLSSVCSAVQGVLSPSLEYTSKTFFLILEIVFPG